MRELYYYNAVVDRVVDGDTLDMTIDLDIISGLKKESDYMG